jgi:hypothetical protein
MCTAKDKRPNISVVKGMVEEDNFLEVGGNYSAI